MAGSDPVQLSICQSVMGQDTEPPLVLVVQLAALVSSRCKLHVFSLSIWFMFLLNSWYQYWQIQKYHKNTDFGASFWTLTCILFNLAVQFQPIVLLFKRMWAGLQSKCQRGKFVCTIMHGAQSALVPWPNRWVFLVRSRVWNPRYAVLDMELDVVRTLRTRPGSVY